MRQGLLVLCVLGLAACNTAQGVKRDVAQGAEVVGEALHKSGEAVEGALKKGGEVVGDTLKKGGETVQKVVN